MKKSVFKKAFLKSLPVLAGYIVLGIGFGILLKKAGYGVLWSFEWEPSFMPVLCSLLV